MKMMEGRLDSRPLATLTDKGLFEGAMCGDSVLPSESGFLRIAGCYLIVAINSSMNDYETMPVDNHPVEGSHGALLPQVTLVLGIYFIKQAVERMESSKN